MLGMYRNPYWFPLEFRREFDEMWDRMMGEWPRAREPKMLAEAFTPMAEAWMDQEAKKYYLRIALPGIEPKDVKVEVQGKVLTITGERKATEEKKEATYTHREFTYGAFERVVTLPEGIETEKLAAEFKNGVLEITAPIAAAVLPHKVEVKPEMKKAA